MRATNKTIGCRRVKPLTNWQASRETHEAVTKTPPQGAGKVGLRGSDTLSID